MSGCNEQDTKISQEIEETRGSHEFIFSHWVGCLTSKYRLDSGIKTDWHLIPISEKNPYKITNFSNISAKYCYQIRRYLKIEVQV